MRRRIRLSESDLHRVIKESVKQILREYEEIEPNKNYLFGTPFNVWGDKPHALYAYDRFGNKMFWDEPEDHWNMLHSHWDENGLRYDDDEWDEYNNQPELATIYQQEQDPTTPFAQDNRNLKQKSFMAPGGQYEKDLAALKKKEAQQQKRADKTWQKAADSRPLHRKGSLNR